MLLTEKRLRALIHDILLEGVREDAAALEAALKDNPEPLRKFQSLSTKPKWVNWLADRYLRQKYPVDDTLPDVLSLVVKFASKDAAISQKYGSNEQFKATVDAAFPPEIRGWQNPSDATKMTSSDLNTLLALHDRKKQRIEVDRADESWKQDKIGKFGDWELYFPTSQQNSINIAGADPVTLKGYTDWCTARTAGSNLFYNYAGQGIMLFYAIDESKPVTDPKGRISLGYEDGVLDVSGEDGHVTVDAQNKGLKMPALRRIFGSHLNGILAAAEAVVKHHGSKHPAVAEIAAARQDVVKFKSMLSGLSDDEAGDLCEEILPTQAKDVSPDVLIAAASHKSAAVRFRVASLSVAPRHILEKLAADTDAHVRSAVASNRSTPPHVFEKLATDANSRIRERVAANESTPVHVFEKLADDADAKVRYSVTQHESIPLHVFEKLAANADVNVRWRVAKNPSTPLHVLEKLASDADRTVRREVSQNKSVPPHVLEKLAADTDAHVRSAVAIHDSTPLHVFEKLAADTDAHVRSAVAGNRSIPFHILEKLAGDPSKGVQSAIVRNESTPAHVLEKLVANADEDSRESFSSNSSMPPYILEKWAFDSLERVRRNVAFNKSTPSHVLEKLAGDADVNVRMRVAQNPSTPSHVLEKLSSDPHESVRYAVSHHKSTPPHTLEKLAADPEERVRMNVAYNQKTPLSALRALAQHEDVKTRKAAQATLAKLQPMGEARRLAHRIIAELKRR